MKIETRNAKETRIRQSFLMAVIGIVFLLCFAAGCRKAEVDETGQSSVLNMEAEASPIIGESQEKLSAAVFLEHMLYYAGYENTEETELRVYARNLDTGENERLYSSSMQGEGRILHMTACRNAGVVYLLQYGQPETEHGAGYELIQVSLDGQEQGRYDVNAIPELQEGEGPDSVKFMAADGKGQVYLVVREGDKDSLLIIGDEAKLENRDMLPGLVQALFVSAQGQVYCVLGRESAGGYQTSVMIIQQEDGELTLTAADQDWPEDLTGIVASAWGEDAFLISSGDTIYRFDCVKNSMEAVGNWLTYGINSDDIVQITGLDEDRVAVLAIVYSAEETDPYWELTILGGQGEVKAEQEKRVLTLATMDLDVMLRSWIVEYNKAHPDCIIEVKEYGDGDYAAGIMRLNADIVSGNGPDVLDLSDMDISAYISKGVLTNLYPFLEADEELSENDILPGVLGLYEEGDGLYGMTPGITLETLMGRYSDVGEQDEWTIGKVQEVIRTLSEGTELIENLKAVGFLRILLHIGMDSYINWDTGECFFDGEEFIKVLELANSIPESVSFEESTEDKIASGSLILYRAYISEIGDYLSAVACFGGDSVVGVGYPSEDGGHASITSYMPLGILESCEAKQEAWEFVKSLFSEAFQTQYMHFQLPARIDVLQSEMESYVDGSVLYGEMEVTQKDMDMLCDIIDSGLGSRAFNADIWNMIQEESEYYFEGEKTAEETAAVIQRRVEIYVSENR